MANYAQWRAVSSSLVTESDKWPEVSDAGARLWLHLLLRCDSFGCIDGDAYIVWARCMKRAGWSKVKTAKAMQELVDADLLHVWNDDGYEWSHIVGFDGHQQGEFLRKRGRRQAPKPPCELGGECTSTEIGRRTLRPPIETETETDIEQNRTVMSAITDDPIVGDAQSVFDHWVAVDVATGGGKAGGRILNRKRRDKIIALRREGYTVEQMCDAITAFCNDPWHLGKNPSRKRYTGLLTLIKHGDKIEQGLVMFAEQQRSLVTKGEYVRPVAHV